MTSTASPMPHSPSRLASRRESPYSCSDPSFRINWPIILASASASLTLVAGIFTWIATHPHKAAQSPMSQSVAALELPVELEPYASPQVPSIPATPALHQTPHVEKSVKIPQLEVDSPPLPPPTPPQPKQPSGPKSAWTSPWQLPAPPAPKKPTGENYGTQVLFLSNQEAAAEMARQEHKLMFVMHISGNFEDSCFT